MSDVQISANLYTTNANLSAAKRLIKEVIDEIEDGEDKDDLAQAHRHVEDAMMRLKRYGHAGRLLE